MAENAPRYEELHRVAREAWFWRQICKDLVRTLELYMENRRFDEFMAELDLLVTEARIRTNKAEQEWERLFKEKYGV